MLLAILKVGESTQYVPAVNFFFSQNYINLSNRAQGTSLDLFKEGQVKRFALWDTVCTAVLQI